MYPDPISFGLIPADSIASLDAFKASSIILSLSLPYLVLPAPRTQTLLAIFAIYIFEYKNVQIQHWPAQNCVLWCPICFILWWVKIYEYPRDLSREHPSEEIVMKDWTYFYD